MIARRKRSTTFAQESNGPITQVALYARVSTLNNQDPEMQLAELREYAGRRGWQIVEEFTDQGVSGCQESRPMGSLGPWRKPKTLEDAKRIADTIIDYMDPEWLLRFGLDLLGVPNTIGVPNAADIVVADWVKRHRPHLPEHIPYFIFMLTINIFFCLVLPTPLLKSVKASHQIDLAYLYYLPFRSVFTSKDNFHADIVPLFMNSRQTFVNGNDLKEELKKLDAYYSALPDEVLRTGLINFAATPPDDASFLTTKLWDKYLPRWREIKASPKPPRDPEADKKLIEEINTMTASPDLLRHDERDMDKINYVTVIKSVKLRKGKWRRFSEESEQKMRDAGELH